jgi:two-component system, OmpR family, sensor histidine kinase MprB
VRLDQIVHEAVDRVQRRHPHVDFRIDSEPATVTGDAEAIARAADNLLDNAGKWTPAGRAVHVRVRAATLEVRDEGPGVDPADVPRIFERFYRGSRASGVPGSGLGLAIVARVVDAHGGTVSVAPAEVGGAVFTVKFASDP